MNAILTGGNALIPVTLLTGFLGSGKTTLLNRLVRDPVMKKALVIINEFGSVGIDHDLVTPSQDEVVVEMASGCLCCTIRGDLVRTLRDAPWRFARDGICWFDRVVIETTGLADPMPILHTLMMDERIAALYRLDSVVTTVDAATGMATLDVQQESVRQAAVADRLLLTKTDLVSADAIARFEARLRTINPAAPLLHVLAGEVDAGRLFGAGIYDPATKGVDVQAWLNAEAYAGPHDHDYDRHHHGGHAGERRESGLSPGKAHDHHDHHHDVNRHDDHIRSACLTFEEPLPASVFERWLDFLQALAGPDILRVKGVLNLAEFDKPVVVQGVQHIFHPPVFLDAWPSDDHRSRIVFITRDVDEVVLWQTLASLSDGIDRFAVEGFENFDAMRSPPVAMEYALGTGGGA